MVPNTKITPSTKIEYPALLDVGFHSMDVAELRSICVDAFPLSTTREKIMGKIEQIVHKLSTQHIKGFVWVDGSFLTEKIDPGDSDIVIQVDGDINNQRTLEQQELIDHLESRMNKDLYICDISILYTWPEEAGEFYWFGVWDKAKYIRLYGLDRNNREYKGIALIEIPN